MAVRNDYFGQHPVGKDVVIEIFSCVDERTLGVCSKVCKAWNALIDNHLTLWQPFNEGIGITPQHFNRCLGLVIEGMPRRPTPAARALAINQNASITFVPFTLTMDQLMHYAAVYALPDNQQPDA